MIALIHPRQAARHTFIRQCLLGLGSAIISTATLAAQTSYTVVDLTPGGYGIAYAASGGQAAGTVSASVAASLTTHAALWTGDGQTDLHPALVGDAATSRSGVAGFAGNLQVGWGAGTATASREVPLAWRDTAASATILRLPFTSWGARALATDGVQIAGYAGPFSRDGTTTAPSHALVWNASTGAVVDLGGGSNGAQALGVGGGQQVGYVLKAAWNAALWKGTSNSLVILQPTGAAYSYAYGTDGARQVGTVTYEVRVRTEAPKGNKTAMFTYATAWAGTAASAINIHPSPVNSSVVFKHSFASSVAGPYIAGYAADDSKIGTPAYYHAIVWNASLQATDLNAFLPAGFIGAQAFSVDREGNIAGYIATASGIRHAALWIPNP